MSRRPRARKVRGAGQGVTELRKREAAKSGRQWPRAKSEVTKSLPLAFLRGCNWRRRGVGVGVRHWPQLQLQAPASTSQAPRHWKPLPRVLLLVTTLPLARLSDSARPRCQVSPLRLVPAPSDSNVPSPTSLTSPILPTARLAPAAL